MRLPGILISSAILSFCLLTQSQAQVYRSTDAEGNVTFSDQPTPESEAVDVPTPNLGDSIEIPPPAPVVEPKPEVVVEEPPTAVEGELVGIKKKSKKRRRPRKEPRGHGR